ncbi:MAG: outer membrane lipoprotein-sorting protein [Deltaproteobacteria bacterium]|nr:outer membrane lipoprotein-sorting protein [Deltaproteobacteria bacterium]MBN2672637.1 outer membrane lipoprotein-sorting protein [Deltaproteobacteria bacterium]
MNPHQIVIVAVMLGFMLLPGTRVQSSSDAPSPDEEGFAFYVLNQIDRQYRGNSSHGILEMSIKTKHWSRTLEMESWSLGQDYSLVKIRKPVKERGSATLKAKNELYTYLNKTGRTIKINSAMMGSSWMGSHFTNDDLVQDTKLATDFTYRLVGSAFWGPKTVTIIELIPKKGRAIVYGKIQVAVYEGSLQPAYQLFFDEDGKKIRKMEYSDYRQSNGRLFPHKMVMKPFDKSGEYTAMQWKQISFDGSLQKSFFSVHRLKSL